jgi:S1-C subfamily serine protease
VAGKPGNLRARVARVTPGSGADFAGIRRGDIVLTWNGIKLTNLTFEEVCKVMDASGDSAEITIAAIDR